uniref:S-acyltransferase n=1 Tax=Kalanchoe fedtschenkoi TaxID=63787 RepID=A0A7N0U444_KALFE
MKFLHLGDSLPVRCSVSGASVLLSQIGLAAVPRLIHARSLIEHAVVSGCVLAGVFVLGRLCKRLLGVKASAPAVVILHAVFLWGVYLAVIRRAPAISLVMDVVLNLELGLIMFGMWRIMHSDPGWVEHDSIPVTDMESAPDAPTITLQGESEDRHLSRRVRHCRICKAHVKGYDHHCPAFGNCIGQHNHVLFLVLLVGFIITEVSYAACCYQYIIVNQVEEKFGTEMGLSGRLAISTMTFCLFQVTWQVFFLAWHVYCVCNNIKTDEWVNWAKYPEFHHNAQPHRDRLGIRFHNPYNKGVFRNLKGLCNQR